MDLDIIETSENGMYRLRLEVDLDSGSFNPRKEFDNAVHVVTVPNSRYCDVDEDGGPLAEGWDHFKYRDDAMTLFQRWARIFHGAVTVHDSPHRGPGAVWYLVPEDIEEAGISPERVVEVIEGERKEYRAWAEGDVYGYVIEKKVTWAPKGDDGADAEIPDEIESWEEVDSCWGLIGREWAEATAREEFDHYRKKGKA